jgi:hypothetical protein
MESAAMKAIVTIGAVAFVLLGLTSMGLKWLIHGGASQVVEARAPQSPFDGKRAFADLEKIVAFGPRPSGTDALAKTRAFIKAGLESAGLPVREWAFDADTPLGVKKMANVFGIVAGTSPGVILLTNHYDTKYLPEIKFVGANDGGSTTAWMLEMARAIGPKREGCSLWLCFFDGEEAFETWSDSDSLYGSRAFVKRLKDEGTFPEIRAEINVDMIGDCYLGVKRDRDAPDGFTKAVWNSAKELGYGEYFLPFSDDIQDDHIPFRKAGIPSLEIIDFSYGGSAIDHARNWHTERDSIERVCDGSLQVVGDVLYHALPKIDTALGAKK